MGLEHGPGVSLWPGVRDLSNPHRSSTPCPRSSPASDARRSLMSAAATGTGCGRSTCLRLRRHRHRARGDRGQPSVRTGRCRRSRLATRSTVRLPDADVVLCREVLFHLSFRDGLAALANIRAAGRWLLATSDTAIWFNSDVATGDFRRINLERAPYRLPRPRAVISDEGVCRGRVLALWPTSDLPTWPEGRSG